jgi:hypothetical protein
MTADELNTWFETTIVGKSLITALGLALVIFGGRFGLKVLAHGWRSVRTREWSRLGESKVWARGWLAMVVGAYEMLIGVFFTAGAARASSTGSPRRRAQTKAFRQPPRALPTRHDRLLVGADRRAPGEF